MRLADNFNIQAEALRRIGFHANMPPEHLTTPNFNRLLQEMDALKASAGPFRNVVICLDCSAVHPCPFGADHENAHAHLRVCGSCGSRSGFRDVVGRWISFSRTWHPSTWGKGCWAFEFCTSPGRLSSGKEA